MKRVTDGNLSVAEGNNNIVFNSRTPDRPRSSNGKSSSPVPQKYSYQNSGASSSSDMNANRSFAPGLVLEEEGFAADL